MTKRKKLNGKMTPMDTLVMMSEGNPGALSVLSQMTKAGRFMSILDLNDMNIRGPQIWLGYKDHCDGDLDRFLKCIEERDQNMVDTINMEFLHPGSRSEEEAVVRGGSWAHVA